ncbi:MAG: transcriptional repressor, partial [Actinomycetota bacterium]|nr:transcriptional repressor [Actinomycetota bacterium]
MGLVTDAQVDEKVASLLHQTGHRYSTVRRRLVSVLRTAGKPLTNNQITESDNSLVQSSVYRNLNVLEQAGAVTRITTNDEFARYELAEHITEHHHHIICTNCGDIADFSLPSSVEDSLDLSLRKAAN